MCNKAASKGQPNTTLPNPVANCNAANIATPLEYQIALNQNHSTRIQGRRVTVELFVVRCAEDGDVGSLRWRAGSLA